MYSINHFLATVVLGHVIGVLGCHAPDADPSPTSDPPAAPVQSPTGPAFGEAFDEPRSFGGRVEGVLEAGHYTYFRLRLGEGDERWVVVAGREHRSAEHLSVQAFARQRDFVSRRLARSFPELYFASVVTAEVSGER